MIKTVIRFNNDDVIVFDGVGEQIPEHQGEYEEVREGILRMAVPETEFFHWFNCAGEPEPVARASW